MQRGKDAFDLHGAYFAALVANVRPRPVGLIVLLQSCVVFEPFVAHVVGAFLSHRAQQHGCFSERGGKTWANQNNYFSHV